MKHLRKTKVGTVFAALFACAALVFSGCHNLEDNDYTTASLTLDKEAITISSALEGRTTVSLSATLTGSGSGLEWYSSDKSIIAVSASGSEATLVCGGSAGTAKVGVRTSDGEMEAFCMVTVSLSATPAQAPSDVAVTTDSETESGFTLTWKDPSIASKVVVDVFETAAERDTANALAAAASDTAPVVYSSYTVKTGVQTLTISDLLTNGTGKTYYISVYGYINGKRSTKAVNTTATLKQDSTAPGNVTDIALAATAADHALSLSWAEPTDSDYKSVTVSITPAEGFAGSLTASESTKTVQKGVTSVAFTKLKANTAYTFTFKTADVNGNAQTTGTTKQFTTAADTTAPAAVTGLAASAGRTAVTLTWTDPDTSTAASQDFKEVRVYQGDASAYTTVAGGVKTLSVTNLAENTAYTFTVKAVDYDGNASAAATVSATTANPVATNVKAAASVDLSATGVTPGVVISWSAPAAVEYAGSEVVTYAYSVEIKNGDTTVLTENVATGVTSLTVSTGLSLGQTYTYTVTTIPSDTGSFVGSDSSVTRELAPLISIKNGWGGRVLVPFKTSTKDYVNCVIVQDDTSKTYNPSVMTYPYWIVRPALDDADGYFSLEAADKDGTASGLYLFFSATTPSGSTDYDVDDTTWGSGGSPHAFTGTVETIGADIGGASFALGANHSSSTAASGYSSWTTVLTHYDSGYCWFSGNSNPYLVATPSTTNNDYAWCYKVITE